MDQQDMEELSDIRPADVERPSRGFPMRQEKTGKKWKRLGSNGLLMAFGIVVLVLVYSFVHRNFISPPVEPAIIQEGKSHIIQLDVLNGAGTRKLGQRFTDHLRARGFDVVEMGNYRDSNVQRTKVIDRVGNLQAALQVAQALGVPKEQVVREIDRHSYLDVTVVIGKDFRSLKPLQ